MTQEQLDALLAEIGGGALVHSPAADTTTIKNPAHKSNGGTSWTVPKELTIQVQRWHDPASGRVVEAYQKDDGSGWSIIRNTTDKGLVKVGAAPGAAPAPQSPAEQRTAREEAEIARNAALPPDQDPRSETDAQRAQRAATTIKEQGAAARQGQIDADTRQRQQQQDARQAQIDAQNLATAKAAADAKNEPQVIYREVKNPDGSTRNIQVRIHPGGREEIVASNIPGQPAPREAINVHKNPETGEWEEVYRDPVTGRAAVRVVPPPNGPAGPKSPAPLLPQIVVGQSQDALRTAYTQIQEEVDSGRRNTAWGDKRRQEVFDAAQLTVQEAQLVEQSRQANQTTGFNVSNTVLQYGQSALENSLKFTISIMDKLQPGSGSGGKMFAALFSMQMKMAKDSGIYDLGVPRGSSFGAPSAPGQPAPPAASRPRLTNVGDPAAVEADHQRSRAELLAAGDAADAAAAAASPGGRAMTPAYTTPGASNVPGVAPITSTPAMPGGPAVPPPVPLPQPAAAPGAPPPAAMPATAPAPGFGDPGFSPDIGRPQPPLAGQDDPRLVRDPGSPGPPITGPNDPRIQRESYPALEGLRQQFQPQQLQLDPTGGLDQQAGGIAVPGLPPALVRAQIAATPPWRLPMAELQNLVDQHGAETVFGWPGQRLLGVG